MEKLLGGDSRISQQAVPPCPAVLQDNQTLIQARPSL